MSTELKKKIFCPQCQDYVKPRVVRSFTLSGEVIIEYYCPKHGFITSERKTLPLPQRNITPGGLYIVFEGIDGSGKTTQAVMLYEYLSRKNYEVVLVREPWVKAIKDFLYKHDLDPDAEAYLFAADRIILQKEVVLPALEAGKIVISDRSVFASLAYQAARGLPEEFIMAINRSIRLPDIVILLDLNPDEAVKRLKNRGETTRFEDPEFMVKVRDKYLSLAQNYNSLFVVVDASKPIREVHRDIIAKLKERLGHRSINLD
ncbi:MAG: dTMP kinase [Infirmifilum sp.]